MHEFDRENCSYANQGYLKPPFLLHAVQIKIFSRRLKTLSSFHQHYKRHLPWYSCPQVLQPPRHCLGSSTLLTAGTGASHAGGIARGLDDGGAARGHVLHDGHEPHLPGGCTLTQILKAVSIDPSMVADLLEDMRFTMVMSSI